MRPLLVNDLFRLSVGLAFAEPTQFLPAGATKVKEAK